MFRTITAKYPGICKRCSTSIVVGDRIRYGGPGRTYHLAAVCGAQQQTDGGHAPNVDDQIERQSEQDQHARDGFGFGGFIND